MNVGARTLSAQDHVQGAQVPVLVLYPTEAPAATQAFGPYSVELALDAPVVGARLPLPVVAISHTGTTDRRLHARHRAGHPRRRALALRGHRGPRQAAPHARAAFGNGNIVATYAPA
ncbi:MAG: hypothetical protein SFX73_26825 [Kofleriaceae bacterium]|nr:hypothetical protein [Kofleriaceae bacterium]